jgi:hypothetical protein
LKSRPIFASGQRSSSAQRPANARIALRCVNTRHLQATRCCFRSFGSCTGRSGQRSRLDWVPILRGSCHAGPSRASITFQAHGGEAHGGRPMRPGSCAAWPGWGSCRASPIGVRPTPGEAHSGEAHRGEAHRVRPIGVSHTGVRPAG